MKVTIIYNPTAGSANRLNRPARLVWQLTRQGHDIAFYTTKCAGDATRLAQQAVAEGCDVVVGMGGDGTLNEIIQGLAGSEVALAAYPSGTTNVWCQQVRMPINPRRAADVISGGQRRRIDLGRANDRYFLLMVGIGLDGEITEAIDHDLKKRLGKLAYAVAALRLVNFRGTDVTITLDNGDEPTRKLKLRTSLIIITNAERYATIKLAREAQVDDGQLELLVFEGSKLWSKLARTVSVLTSRSEHDMKIVRYRMQHAHIASDPPVAAQLDGDPAGRVGSQPINIECVPAALRVIVPDRAPEYLFSRPA